MSGIHLTSQVAAGWLWSLVILGILAPVVAIAAGAWCAWSPKARGGKVWFLSGLLVAVASFAIFVGANWPPFSMEYHTFKPVTVTVGQVTNRFIASGVKNGGSSQRYEVVDRKSGRASGLKAGQVVTFMCVLQWESNGIPGEVCNWGEDGPNR